MPKYKQVPNQIRPNLTEWVYLNVCGICISFGSAALRCKSTACNKILWSLSAYVVAIDALTIAVVATPQNPKA